MDKLTGKATLLIRNPANMVISHRNLDSGGHNGFANPDMFKVILINLLGKAPKKYKKHKTFDSPSTAPPPPSELGTP